MHESPQDSPTVAASLALVDAIEARILGSLIEKEATTPEAYPLTANALLLACNQKNNRDPVLELEPGEVGHALRVMEERGLVRSVHGARAQRYEHRFNQSWSVTLKQQAILSVMLLRGPQTVAELLNRCERLQAFADTEEVRLALDRLMQRNPALVIKLGRQSGQREDRYMHLLCGPVDEAAFATSARPSSGERADPSDIESRLESLEARVAELEAELQQLRQTDT
ncbi:MAG: hypothetical protein A3E01_20400 [Gammaproteobacteria bacterium RIFCSPHIGHO2_12_FULL_63_22]|nr:MAG: hypothetical protein A3E01_20400 [Gammaproteobacteria bacterium RIFCSPHIGHO2_12_FULL_63_22]